MIREQGRRAVTVAKSTRTPPRPRPGKAEAATTRPPCNRPEERPINPGLPSTFEGDAKYVSAADRVAGILRDALGHTWSAADIATATERAAAYLARQVLPAFELRSMLPLAADRDALYLRRRVARAPVTAPARVAS